jgi:hypothetical protein
MVESAGQLPDAVKTEHHETRRGAQEQYAPVAVL